MISITNDQNVEPHPLWEYPSYALSEVFPVISFDFTTSVPRDSTITSSGQVTIDSNRYVPATWLVFCACYVHLYPCVLSDDSMLLCSGWIIS